MKDELKVDDTVRLIDNYKKLREECCHRQREYYMKLANPDKIYMVENIDSLGNIYLEGETQYTNPNLLEKCI